MHDHYRAHRLSVWLALIPRLHAPVDIAPTTPLQSHYGGTGRKNNQRKPGATPTPPEMDGSQLFYLRHHLLPDHENMETYAGVVRGVELALSSAATAGPGAGLVVLDNDLIAAYGRKNMSSIYEAQQKLVYSRHGTIEGLNRRLVSAANAAQAGRDSPELLGRRTASSSPSSPSSPSSSSPAAGPPKGANGTPNSGPNSNGQSSGAAGNSKASTGQEVGRTSVLHYSVSIGHSLPLFLCLPLSASRCAAEWLIRASVNLLLR